jgi:hypothetical protein
LHIRPIPPRSVILLLLVFLAGCASTRSVQIGSEPGPVYSVDIRNTLSEDMIVSYDDGAGARTLGTVRAGGSERFIIASPARQNVTITARNNAGTQSSGPYQVQLVAGESRAVALR